MKRLLIAAGLILFGALFLPIARPFIEEVADTVIASMVERTPPVRYAAFIELFADHAYLVAIAIWIAFIAVILFLSGGDKTNEIQSKS